MIRWFWNLLYETERRDFLSAFGLEESVQRLAAATERPSYRSVRETAIGKVSASRVRLHRYRPTLNNGLKPIFVGRFVEERRRVILRGKFSAAPFVKFFMTVWLAFAALWTLGALHSLLTGATRAWGFPLAGLALFAGGVALVWMCKRMARHDVAWLCAVIAEALACAPDPSHARRASMSI